MYKTFSLMDIFTVFSRFLHSKGITYCALKPSNILLDENGHIKVSMLLSFFMQVWRLFGLNDLILLCVAAVRFWVGKETRRYF